MKITKFLFRAAHCSAVLCLLGGLELAAAQSLTWDQVKARFEAGNPALKADALNVDEMRAEEITAYLRPNPQFNFAVGGTQFPPHTGPWRPLPSVQERTTFSYLHERQHKRELRLESAVEGTRILKLSMKIWSET